MNRRPIACSIFVALLFVCAHGKAQMPADVAGKLRAIGRVVNPPATAALYLSRVVQDPLPESTRIERDIQYGPAARNLLDVFAPVQPPSRARPVVVFVHGGGFMRGDRRLPGGSPFYDNVMRWVVSDDMVGVNITYRMVPQAAWPSGADDLALALRWVNAHVAERGGDPQRIFVIGHSTGAGIVASYLARQSATTGGEPALAGAMLMSGLYELSAAMLDGDAAAKAYFGDDPSRFGERSALPEVVSSAVPLWVGYAELDPPKYEQQARRLDEALCAAKHCPVFLRFADHSHMSEVYSIHTDDRGVGDALRDFIRAH